MCMCVYVLWVGMGVVKNIDFCWNLVRVCFELGCLWVLYLLIKCDIKSCEIYFKGNFLIVWYVFLNFGLF